MTYLRVMRFFAQERKLSNVKLTGPVSLYRQIVYQRKLTWFRGEAMSVFSVKYITVVSRLQAEGTLVAWKTPEDG